MTTTPPPATPVFIQAYSSLNDPRAWLDYPAFEPPLSMSQICDIQLDIDAIIGTTRENQSIAKLVWNGDINFWKSFHNKWDQEGKPVGDLFRRPRVLYKSIKDPKGAFVRDSFPPRWLLLTRIEPEQYVSTWKNDSLIFCRTRQKFIQFQPVTPPPVYYVWFMTIAEHGVCCQEAAKYGAICYGKYAHPRACLATLRATRKGMEADGIFESHPFDSPDRVTRRLREGGLNNYVEQAVNEFQATVDRTIDESPLAMIDPYTGAHIETEKQAKEILREESKRAVDVLEQELIGRKIDG